MFLGAKRVFLKAEGSYIKGENNKSTHNFGLIGLSLIVLGIV